MLTRAAASVLVLSLYSTWVGAREQGAPENRPTVQAPARPVASSSVRRDPHRAVLDRYCVTCHNERLKTAGLSLETIDTTSIGAAADGQGPSHRIVR